jgi:hypothetical protein
LVAFKVFQFSTEEFFDLGFRPLHEKKKEKKWLTWDICTLLIGETDKVDDGDGTLGLVIGRRLDERALPRKDRLELGLFPDFVDFDGFGRSLELEAVGFTFFLQPTRRRW